MLKPELVGAWHLVSLVAESSNGERREPWGPEPKGRLIYSGDGHVAVVFTKKHRTRFVSNDPLGGTLDEIKEAFEGLEAYAGRYSFDEKSMSIRHDLEVCRLPNWEGTSQLRFVEFKDNELILRTPLTIVRGVEVVLTLVWCKDA